MEYCRSEGSWWCYWGLHAHSQNCPLHQDQSESLPLLSLVQRTGCSPAASIRQFSVYVPLEVKMQSWSQKKWEENICNSKAPWGGKDGHWEGLFSCQVIYISRWESRSVIIYSSRFWKHKNKGSWRTGYHINSAYITDNKNIQRWILTLKKKGSIYYSLWQSHINYCFYVILLWMNRKHEVSFSYGNISFQNWGSEAVICGIRSLSLSKNHKKTGEL